MKINYAEKKLIDKKKEFNKYLFLSMSLLFLLYFFFTMRFKEFGILKDCKEFYFVGFVSTGYIGLILSKLEFDCKVVYRILLVFITFITIYLCLIHCYLSYTVYSYYIPVTIFIIMVSNKKVGAFFGTLFFVLCLFTRHLALKYGFSGPKVIPEKLSLMLITLSISVFYSLFLIYYYIKFRKIELEIINAKEKNEILNNESTTLDLNGEVTKFEKLYNEIIEYLTTKKEYQNSKFSKEMLAKSLNTNGSYISAALNQYGNKNFNKLINEYRINQVKEELENKKLENFTLEHIYLKAGFTQQSTFNRVFKEIVGITPTEYIDEIDKKQ